VTHYCPPNEASLKCLFSTNFMIIHPMHTVTLIMVGYLCFVMSLGFVVDLIFSTGTAALRVCNGETGTKTITSNRFSVIRFSLATSI